MSKRQSIKLLVWVVALLLLTTASLASAAKPVQRPVQLARLYGEFELTSAEHVNVIVELTAESIVEAKQNGRKQTPANLAKARGNAYGHMKKAIGDVTLGREYYHLFSGMSVRLPANQITTLLSVPGVRAVYPDVVHTITPQPSNWELQGPYMDQSAPYVGAQTVWETLGYTGKGVVVAIIDTGVDYTHPDLAHAFGAYKGWDFVDNDNDPQETPPIGGDYDLATTHGTHVAGTVAANGQIKGVAPEATLLAYRVLGPGGSGYTSDVVAGIERAVLDGAHIMNLSLGNSLNNPDWVTSLALDRAMAEGVVAVTSNGNNGPDNWTVGSPGTSREAISVGATQLPYAYYGLSLFTSEGMAYPSARVMGYNREHELLALQGNTYDFAFAGFGLPGDFAGLDLTGKIALVSRGQTTFWNMALNAKAAGAVGVIVFNNVAGEIPFELPGIPLPMLKLTNADGLKLLAELEAGNNQVTIGLEYLFTIPELVADFSSRGPVMKTWMIKPDVVAPGVNITSTVPTHDPDNPHGYDAYQGTSMASPHVAGAAALLLQANPQWNPYQVKAALMNTAQGLVDPYSGQPYPHNAQGAGSIRVDRAIQTKTLVIPGSYSFGHFEDNAGVQKARQHFFVHNLSNQRKAYTISVEFAGHPQGISVEISNNLRVNGGRSQRVNVNVEVDTSKLAPGYYEGTITISDGTETILVPAILFVGALDYPLIADVDAFIDPATGELVVWLNLMDGADLVYGGVYTLGWGLVGWTDLFLTEVAPGWLEVRWDWTLAGGSPVPSGTWIYAIDVEKGDRWDYVAWRITIP